jgi:hypothetical protein
MKYQVTTFPPHQNQRSKEENYMKKLMMALSVVTVISLPGWASFPNNTSESKSDAVLSTLGKSIENTLAIQQALRSENSKSSVPARHHAFLPSNPYQSYFDQFPLARTELKIDLDNFDMEYVLKVQ